MAAGRAVTTGRAETAREDRSGRRSRRSYGSSHERNGANGQSAERSDLPDRLILRIVLTLICAVGGYFLFRFTFAENATPPAIGIMSALVPVLFGVYFAMTWGFRPLVFITGLPFVLGVFVFLVHLRQRAFDDTSYDWAVIVQLVVVAAGGLWALANARKILSSWPWLDPIAALLMALFLLLALSLAVSPNPGYGAASLATLAAFFAIAATMCVLLRSGEIQALLALAIFPSIVLSLVSFYAQTEIDFTWGISTDYSVPRLRGVAGTPVGLSNQCLLLVLACYARLVTAKKNRAAWIAFCAVAIPAALTVAYLSESRTPPAAAVLALLVVSVLYFKPFGRFSVLISVIGGLAFLPFAYFLIEQGVTETVLASLSRTGQAKEIQTLTGRLEMWQMAFTMIAERPFLGYGFGSGIVLLPEAFEGTDLNIVHFHNLAIQTAFSAGVAGSVLITLLIVMTFFRAYRCNDLLAMLIVLYLALTNITETSVLANKPSIYTFAFMLVVCRVLFSTRLTGRRSSADNGTGRSGAARHRRRATAD